MKREKTLPLHPPYAPMEALLVSKIPEGPGWQYEPKWDGFRCLAFRDGAKVELQSKSGQPLTRYFPEVVRALASLRPGRFVLDSEIVVPAGPDRRGGLSFDALLQRIHPAASRVKKLSEETPAIVIAFDLLVDASGKLLVKEILEKRRPLLEKFAADHFDPADGVRLSPATRDARVARKWFESSGGALDGIIAKRLDLDYRSGERTGMQKVKRLRTADCVAGGFRYASSSRVVGSLLLGLYGPDGLLHHVGFTSGFSAAERKDLLKKLRPLIKPPGFTGKAPGGPSRWSTDRSTEWEPLAPKLVVEVRYDHFTGGRFRHGTKLLRWRPDKSPRQCKLAQVEAESRASLRLLDEAAPRSPKRRAPVKSSARRTRSRRPRRS